MIDDNAAAARRRGNPQHNLPWTVARCNRLLRSISSRIATIRRIVDNFNPETAQDTKSSATSAVEKASPAVVQRRWPTTHCALLGSPLQHDDPEWMPQVRKAASRIYGGKARSGHIRRAQLGEVTESPRAPLRTPFLRKLLRPRSDDSPLAQPALREISSNANTAPAARRSTKLPIRAKTSLGEAQQQLLTAFANFLRATNATDAPTRKGARSFRDMCLNQIPQHVAAEQAWLDEQGNDGADADASDEVYSFLEGLGLGEKSGYPGLRLVVRSHGARMIRQAIGDGLLSDTMVRQLVETCRSCEAAAEGQALVSAWMEKVTCERTALHPRSVRLCLDLCDELRSHEFLLRLLAHFAERGAVSKAQLEACGPLWGFLLSNLAAADGRLDAMRFFEAYLLAPADESSEKDGRGQLQRSQGSSWSTVALLTAVVLKQQGAATGLSDSGSLAWQQQRLMHSAHAAFFAMELDAAVRPFVLSGLLTTAADSSIDATFLTLDDATILATLYHPAGGNKNDVDFFLEVIRIISHVDADAALDTVKALTTGLARLASDTSDPRHANFLQNLAVNGAMAWAEERDAIESYDWAEQVEGLFTAARRATPHTAAAPCRYRWEHGLSEWIQATPYTHTSSRQSEEAKLEDSGVCMPSSESPSRKRSRAAYESEEEDDGESDLEERDELALRTPELVRLRDQRARKAARLCAEKEKENAESMGKSGRMTAVGKQQRKRLVSAMEEMSEDELGL